MNFKCTSRLGMLLACLFLISSVGWGESNKTSILNNFDNETTATSIEEECNLAFTTEQLGVFCNEATGQIRVRISGGTAPFKVEWDNVAGTIWDEVIIRNRSITLDHLPPGIYTIKIADEFGCFQKQEICLKDQVSTMGLTVSNNSSACDTQGSIAVSVGNSAPPYWVIVDGPSARGLIINESTFTIDGLLEGDYSITVRKEDCEQTREITVTNSDASLDLQLETIKTRSCDGDFGSIATNITGGHPPYRLYFEGTTYGLSNGLTHSDGAKLVQNLTPGVYKFTVIDAEMCTVSKTMRASGPTTPPVTVTTRTTVDPCTRTGTIRITGRGGVGPYILSWHGAMFRSTISNRTYTAMDVPFGTYTVGVEDQEGCMTTTEVTLDSDIPQLKFGATATRGKCGEKGSVDVNITSGTAPFQIALNGDSKTSSVTTNTMEGLSGGTYEIVVTDATGCVETSTVTLAPESPAVVFTAIANEGACGIKGSISGTITSGTAPYILGWEGGGQNDFVSVENSFTIPNLNAGDYELFITDEEGCQHTVNVSLASEGVAVAFTPTTRPGSCGTSGTIDVSVSSGNAPFEISWTGTTTGSITVPTATYTIPDLEGGAYTITVNDGSNCTHTNTVSLAAATPAVQFSATAQPGACGVKGSISGSITSGTAPYFLAWNGGGSSDFIDLEGSSFDVSNLEAGTYELLVRDAAGCQHTTSVSLASEGESVQFTAAAHPGLCGGKGSIDIVSLSGTGPYDISWTGP